MATFYGTATALDADTAQGLALEQARSAAFDALGTSIEFTGFDQVYVKANNDGTARANFQDFTWTARYQVQAVQVDTPPPADGEDANNEELPPLGDPIVIAPNPVLNLDITEQTDGGDVNTGPTNVIDTTGLDDGDQIPTNQVVSAPEAVTDDGTTDGIQQVISPDTIYDDGTTDGIQTQVNLDQARNQATLQQQRKQVNNGDWRVRLSLAPNSQYLYNMPEAQRGILDPLFYTNGVIFPYTPAIDTTYKANYNTYDLTHSNYRGYFYQGSHVDSISMRATFTAQDTKEANYLLAVIHFFRSVTKMFYGQDPQRGTPPPLCYLSGLGEYQFNNHPCLVSEFRYSLPDNVDYIRTGSVNINGTDLLLHRDRQTTPTSPIITIINRLISAGLTKGAEDNVPAPPTLGLNSPSYVPTKIEINLTLLPVQSRSQVSKQFSLKGFANGNLLKGGFW
jgi:hypothetical protein